MLKSNTRWREGNSLPCPHLHRKELRVTRKEGRQKTTKQDEANCLVSSLQPGWGARSAYRTLLMSDVRREMSKVSGWCKGTENSSHHVELLWDPTSDFSVVSPIQEESILSSVPHF